MLINKSVIKHMRLIESSLFESLDVDQYNSEHSIRLLNKNKCKLLLKDCTLSKYCISIYLRYLYPVYFYIEFTNNFLNVSVFSEYMDLSIDQCNELIENGKQILNVINKK